MGDCRSSLHLFTLNGLGDFMQLQSYFQTLSWFNFMLNWLIAEHSDISTENLLESFYTAELLLYSCGWDPNGRAATYLGNPGFVLWLSWESCASRPLLASGGELPGVCFAPGSKSRSQRSPVSKMLSGLLCVFLFTIIHDLFQLLRKFDYLIIWVRLNLKEEISSYCSFCWMVSETLCLHRSFLARICL